MMQRPWLALALFVAVTCTFNALTFSSAQSNLPDWLVALIVGAWVVQPLVYAAGVALGDGHWATRLPLTFLCLVLGVSALAANKKAVARVEQYEFLTLAATAAAIFVLTSGILRLGRRLRGWQMRRQERNSDWQRVQFSVGYLLVLTTLAAVALGTLSQMTFQPPRAEFSILGPSFVIFVITVGAAYCFVSLLPVLAAALAILSSGELGNYWRRIAGLWLVIALVVVVSSAAWLNATVGSSIKGMLAVQVGGASVAALGVLLARGAGYRLEAGTNAAQRPVATTTVDL
jgi:hypothetical protein